MSQLIFSICWNPEEMKLPGRVRASKEKRLPLSMSFIHALHRLTSADVALIKDKYSHLKGSGFWFDLHTSSDSIKENPSNVYPATCILVFANVVKLTTKNSHQSLGMKQRIVISQKF